MIFINPIQLNGETQPMSTKTVFLIAGEPSGDEHAAKLIRSMRNSHPDIELIARNEDHAKILTSAWKKPKFIMNNFNARDLDDLCKDD